LRIALVNPRIESFISTLPPLGLLYIAALLEKNGFEVRVFDIYPNDDRDIPGLLSYNPEVVGMTVLTDYWLRAKHIAAIIRKGLPRSTFIVGGVHVTALAEESLHQLDADIGVTGEGELTMLELCRRLERSSDWKDVPGIVFKGEDGDIFYSHSRGFIDDLDQLPHPARHLLDFENYLIPPGMIRGYWSERSTTVMTSRGCPFACIWCGSQCTFGKKVRSRSLDNVIDELQSLIDDFAIDTVWFVDDTFTLNKNWVFEFCEKIISDKIKLAWGCQAHVKTANEEMFKTMKEAGCVQLDFGVESGSNKVLRSLRKNSDRETIERAFSAARKAKLRTLATFMFGSPNETEEDIAETFDLVKRIRPNYTSSYFLTPYPGTELNEMARENGWSMSTVRGAMGLKKKPRLLIYFSEKKLLRIRKDFHKITAFRNFTGLLISPRDFLKALQLITRYPVGLLCGIRAFVRTFVFNDFLFAFLNYYINHKAGTQKKSV